MAVEVTEDYRTLLEEMRDRAKLAAKDAYTFDFLELVAFLSS